MEAMRALTSGVLLGLLARAFELSEVDPGGEEEPATRMLVA